MTMKEMIDIEALLHRAYGQYRVHKVTPASILGLQVRRGSPSGFAAAMSILELGTRVDTSGAGARLAGLQSMHAATPDDLLIVHDHVLALADWLIEGAGSVEPIVWRRQEIAANGWTIEDRADGLWLVRPKGELASRLTDPYLCAMVIEHATDGTRPVWRRMPRNRPDAAAAADIRVERALYAVWHAALTTLAAELQPALARHAATGPSAPAEPWMARPLRDVNPETPVPAEEVGAL